MCTQNYGQICLDIWCIFAVMMHFGIFYSYCVAFAIAKMPRSRFPCKMQYFCANILRSKCFNIVQKLCLKQMAPMLGMAISLARKWFCLRYFQRFRMELKVVWCAMLCHINQIQLQYISYTRQQPTNCFGVYFVVIYLDV